MPAYPTVTNGDTEIVSGLPYTETDEFLVMKNDLECGKAYALNWDDGPQRRTFIVRHTVNEREEIQAIEDFFEQMGGRLGTFEFTDDNGTVWSKCRFADDRLALNHVGVNQISLEVRIRAIL